MSGKSIGYVRLVEACEKPGCPVCRCLVDDGRRQLDALLYEQVNDPDVRRRLRAAWGLCNWHTWTLQALGGAVTGSAILYADLIRVAARRVGRLRDRRPARLARWPRRSRPRLVDRYRSRAPCPVCRTGRDAEARYVDTVVDFIDDPEFMRAYGKSSGMCVAHAVTAVERRAGASALRRLLDETLGKWEDLRQHLDGFVRKHEYRNVEPISEAEAAACAAAWGLVAGAPGVFGNDLH
ncbi:MAG TPA: DUF6062 family protein [Methylomirabilota bacterium]|jgi:hypothetical protein|nr:DUF6062 family protein [Methylomirabilota bacterium]